MTTLISRKIQVEAVGIASTTAQKHFMHLFSVSTSMPQYFSLREQNGLKKWQK